ncbi:MAG: hypothetical protein Q7W51_07845 [Coriobacteriia bacterium]|nr:hypothetical protein [Coriobacteriia bacterium]
MRAEHVEAMERTEALMRESPHTRGHNFGHSVLLPLLGFGVIAGLIGLVFLLQLIQSASVRFVVACGVPLALVLVLALALFIRNRLMRGR